MIFVSMIKWRLLSNGQSQCINMESNAMTQILYYISSFIRESYLREDVEVSEVITQNQKNRELIRLAT